jgi:hypothetical protein
MLLITTRITRYLLTYLYQNSYHNQSFICCHIFIMAQMSTEPRYVISGMA